MEEDLNKAIDNDDVESALAILQQNSDLLNEYYVPILFATLEYLLNFNKGGENAPGVAEINNTKYQEVRTNEEYITE